METQGKPRVQEYPGLDAGGFLMIALAHLVKARELLENMTLVGELRWARLATKIAADLTRDALDLLDKLKEEPCEKS